MIPLLYLWNGKLLYRTIDGVTGLATSAACCCTEPAGCCGRSMPGNGSLEGPGYYPLTLHARITRGTCNYPTVPIEFDLTWNASLLVWENTGVSFGDGSYSVTTMRLTCNTPNWSAGLTGGICGCGGVSGSCQFEMTPTLTLGECDPVDLDATVSLVGLMCCGNLGGGTVSIEVWE